MFKRRCLQLLVLVLAVIPLQAGEISLSSEPGQCSLQVPQFEITQSSACQARNLTCRQVLQAVSQTSLHDFCTGPRSGLVSVARGALSCLQTMPKPVMDFINGTLLAGPDKAKAQFELIHRCENDSDFRATLQSVVPLETQDRTGVNCAKLVLEWQQAMRQTRLKSLQDRAQAYAQRLQSEGLRLLRTDAETYLARWLGRETDQLQCLTSQAMAELWCYRLFAAVDPLMLAGMGSKAFQLIRAVRMGPSPRPPRLLADGPHLIPKQLPRNPQLEIWRFREMGMDEAADQLEEGIRNTFKYGKIVSSTPAGRGDFGARFVRFENGLEAVWKPDSAQGIHTQGNEVASYLVDRQLGINRVPLTVGDRRHRFRTGILQVRMSDLHERPMQMHNPRSLVFFDAAILNSDRHPGNFLMTRDGRPVAIDHGVAFNPKESFVVPPVLTDLMENGIKPGPEPLPHFGGLYRLSSTERGRFEALRNIQDLAVSRNTIERMRNTSFDEWQRILGPHQKPETVREFYQRQQDLIQAMDHAERLLGPGVYVDGPMTPVEFFHQLSQ